ncbi:STM4014 family protein [Actinoplanes sp. NPDC049802]|uniref:STM4014 family protein n=1 Tax=Actinoplanes sp. NPDC049802 TaxID=3154742 RepID=UPI0034027149
MRLAVVGNPANRRVTLFTAAARRSGLPSPAVYPWRDLLLSGHGPGPGELVRIDSPGEDAEVDRLLRSLGSGHPQTTARHGEILGTAAAFAGLRAALDRITAGGGLPLSLPADILTMTDKRRCHALLSSAGVPVPPALTPSSVAPPAPASPSGATFSPASPAFPASPSSATFSPAAPAGSTSSASPSYAAPSWPTSSASSVTSSSLSSVSSPLRALPTSASSAADRSPFPAGGFDGYGSLRAAMRAAGWSRVFVKPAHGSSASGVVALATAGRRVTAITSVELSGGSLFNNLRVRRYDDESAIRTIIDRLAPDGLHVEQWFPKASLGDRVVDLRVVTIAGRPRHVVVRTSRSPMTNLHLGNARGDVEAVRAAAGERSWSAAMETCERVAACFPRTLQAGVDLMFRVGWRDHAVAEVNAFGDLLPGVLVDGLDTYGAQVAAIPSWAGAACAS